MKIVWIFLCFHLLNAELLETFYGSFDITEPVLLELIQAPSFQRLKHIHQYGVSYYTTHKEPYTRYDHSVGVFIILRKNGASLQEQIAGLLHDVSHTLFSHVGDWIFKKQHEETDYQNSIHERFLQERDLGAILKKYNIDFHQVLPLEELFPSLEKPAPDLCADRIDYNIQGAYYQKFLSKEEALEIFHDLRLDKGIWISTRPDLMKKLASFAIFMTEDCWGSPTNDLASSFLAESLLQAIKIHLISWEDLHLGTDDIVWNKLMQSEDPIIKEKMKHVFQAPTSFEIVAPSKADRIIITKFRGINPWITQNGTKVRLTEYDLSFRDLYQQSQEKIKKGWAIRFKTKNSE